ncbi:MAG: coproporphyrinogen III oxidase, partial [Alphaproteobacteria bacterium]|nr:coproporphyrinogen III oxidase [Alphaproteobacteria bacterium]
MSPRVSDQQEQARAWFETLRDRICLALEAIEGGATFMRKPWARAEGGGGVMSML